MGRPKVTLVEDNAGTREALAHLLRRFSQRIELLAALPSAEAFFRSTALHEVDVALFDLKLPGMSGSSAIQTLGEQRPLARAIALTVFEDEDTVLDAMRAGACGYLLKDESPERIISAIEEAAMGAHPLSSRVAGFIIAQANHRPPALVLSEREAELAHALAEGVSYADCAKRMGIALGTVQDYVKSIYRKVDVGSKRELRLWIARQRSRD